MNCKIGDIAVVVQMPREMDPLVDLLAQSAIGRFVKIARTISFPDGAIEWVFENPIDLKAGIISGALSGAHDSCLRPIRGESRAEEVTEEITA